MKKYSGIESVLIPKYSTPMKILRDRMKVIFWIGNGIPFYLKIWYLLIYNGKIL